jgi:hypothetical protein
MNLAARRVAPGPNAALAALAMFCMLPVAAAIADGPPDERALAPGMRVRIEAQGLPSSERTGTVSAIDDKAVSLEVPGSTGPVTVRRDQITRFQVSSGRSSRLPHAIVGAAIGALAGTLVANHSAHYPGETAATAAVGALVLGGIGAAIPGSERWVDVPPERYRISLGPRPGTRVGLTMSRGF